MKRKPDPEVLKIDEGQYEGLLQRVQRRELNDQDWKWIAAILETFRFLQDLLSRKNIALKKLKRLLFGSKSEKDKKDSDDSGDPPAPSPGDPGPGPGPEPSSVQPQSENPPNLKPSADPEPKPPAPGHGRRPHDSWPNTTCQIHPHEKLKAGDRCPKCTQGTLYPFKQPGIIARVIGSPPLKMEVHQLSRLRCGRCGELYTAQAPEEVRNHPVATPEAIATAAIIKYQAATPFYRLEGVLKNFGVNLPRTRIWTLIEALFEVAIFVFRALLRWAAQVRLFLHDDTRVLILSLLKENQKNPDLKRPGMHTTSIVAKGDEATAVLFLSGRNHAGENLRDLLLERIQGLADPIRVSDALAANTVEIPGLKIKDGGCLDHCRRNFVEIQDDFPASCRYVLEEMKIIYKADAQAKAKNLDAPARLALHQKLSSPVMERLKLWGETQIQAKQVEPNGALGKAIKYLLNHYTSLTLFLREPGVPISNSECEQSIKAKIPLRNNSYFHKTLRGALASDVVVSLIATSAKAKENAYEYFVALLNHPKDVEVNPTAWFPWNFRLRLATLAAQ